MMTAPAPVLPLRDDAANRILPWFIGLVVCLSVLGTAIAIVSSVALAGWQEGLRDSLTVRIPPAQAGTPDTALSEVLDLLEDSEGIAAARPLGEAELLSLVKPWLEAETAASNLPLPRLIEITVAPDTVLDLEALRRALAVAAPGTVVDDHSRWLGRQTGTVRALLTIAVGGLCGFVVVTLVGVHFMSRTSLAAHRDSIETLHLMGASDSFMVRQFLAAMAARSFVGAFIGLAFGLGLLAAVARSIQTAGQIHSLSLELPPWGLPALTLVPLAAVTLTVIMTRLTVRRTLARMP